MGGQGSGRRKRSVAMAQAATPLDSVKQEAFQVLNEIGRGVSSAAIDKLREFKKAYCPNTEYAGRGENSPCDAVNEIDWVFVQLADSTESDPTAMRLIDERWGHEPERSKEAAPRAMETVHGEFRPGIAEDCEAAVRNFTATYDTSLRILTMMRDRNPSFELTRAVDQFAEQRARAIEDYRRRCVEAGGPPPEVMLPVAFGQVTSPSEFKLGRATQLDLLRYMGSWFTDMIKDEAKAVQEYGEFETLLEEGARKFASDRTFSQFLRDTATNLGQIIVDEQKHHSTFVKLHTELETFGTPSYGQGLGEQVGGAAGGLAAGAAVSAIGAPYLAPIVAPLGAAAGAQAGKYVETTAVPAAAGAIGRATRRSMYGDIVEYGAAFAPSNREAAVSLAETYQAAGQSSFVFFDPVKDRWIVEVGEPTQTERDLIGKDRVRVVHPGTQPPRDPTHRYFLMYTTDGEREGFGAMRPTMLDAVIGMDRPEYGAIILRRAAEKDVCTCATTPEGKQLCTRPGAIGLLSQVQVTQNCSEIIPAADGRLRRAEALRVAQSICGTQVTASDYPDPGERVAARISCLRTVLPTLGKG